MSQPLSGKAAGTTPTTVEDHRRARRRRWADLGIRVLAGLSVLALAVVAGAASYSHMRALADTHGESGWQAHTFPLSVDGVEVVASLVLLADRRVGRRPPRLVWAALVAGTGASMAANVAVGAVDLIGRIVAGWPAFALLVAIKLLSGLVDHPTTTAAPGGRSAVRKRSGVVSSLRSRSGTGRVRGPQPNARTDRSGGPRRPPTPVDVADLLPVARTVTADIIADGGRITRPQLADRLRSAGVSVSNSRLSILLQQLKTETSRAATTDRQP